MDVDTPGDPGTHAAPALPRLTTVHSDPSTSLPPARPRHVRPALPILTASSPALAPGPAAPTSTAPPASPASPTRKEKLMVALAGWPDNLFVETRLDGFGPRRSDPPSPRALERPDGVANVRRAGQPCGPAATAARAAADPPTHAGPAGASAAGHLAPALHVEPSHRPGAGAPPPAQSRSLASRSVSPRRPRSPAPPPPPARPGIAAYPTSSARDSFVDPRLGPGAPVLASAGGSLRVAPVWHGGYGARAGAARVGQHDERAGAAVQAMMAAMPAGPAAAEVWPPRSRQMSGDMGRAGAVGRKLAQVTAAQGGEGDRASASGMGDARGHAMSLGSRQQRG